MNDDMSQSEGNRIMYNKLIKHRCPIEGEMYIELNKPCNWCGKNENK